MLRLRLPRRLFFSVGFVVYRLLSECAFSSTNGNFCSSSSALWFISWASSLSGACTSLLWTYPRGMDCIRLTFTLSKSSGLIICIPLSNCPSSEDVENGKNFDGEFALWRSIGVRGICSFVEFRYSTGPIVVSWGILSCSEHSRVSILAGLESKVTGGTEALRGLFERKQIGSWMVYISSKVRIFCGIPVSWCLGK